jgi:hypothetical protein
MKTIEQQISLMRLHWPRFSLVHQDTNLVMWRGQLAGNEKLYELEIAHGIPLPGLFGGPYSFPVVRVLWPELKPNFDAPEEAPLPHVYFSKAYLPLSPLCLFDPDQSEWTHNDYLAFTTIPWSADWLACYEAWRVTGRWEGGGRHGRRPSLRSLRRCA